MGYKLAAVVMMMLMVGTVTSLATRASNNGYPKVPEDFTITEKDHRGQAGWLAWCLKAASQRLFSIVS